MKHAILDFLRGLAVSDIHLYEFVRRRVAFMDFMLPHDEDFKGLALFGDGPEPFLDIGANDGLSALSYRKLIASRPILSIEANALHEASLKKVKDRIAGFDYRLMGASDERAELTLFTPVFKSVALTNYASTDEETARRNLDAHMRIHRIGERVTFRRTEVKAFPIDDLDLSPRIVKIDVEGHEGRVVAGMRRTLARARPAMMIEYNPASYEAVRAVVSALDYQSWIFDSRGDGFAPYADGEGAAPLNVFWLPREAGVPSAG